MADPSPCRRPARRRAALPALLAVLLAGLLPAVRAAGQAPAPPNVLMIVSDDQGWMDVGYQGSEVRTPVLDRLAREGVRLDHHYVFPTCSPTRAALLTGRNPSRFDILGPIAGRSEQSLPPETVTLASALRGRGYDTALCGKWHLGLRPEVGPRRYGFGQSYGYLHGQIDPHTHRYKNGDRTWHRNEVFLDEEGHATDLIAAEAARFVGARRRPFFLYVAFSVPHTPLAEEEEWTRPYADVPGAPSRKLFAASLTHMDAAIGRVVEALERAGQREKTLIIFTSDNGGQQRGGDAPGEYGGRYGPSPVLGNNRPLRGWKGEVYEGGVRVPAFACWPGTLRPRVVPELVGAEDWLPTVARLAGYRVSPDLRLDGRDIWPLLTGQGKAADRVLYWRTGRQLAARSGEWKLVESRGEAPRGELFRVDTDPNETRDLAAENPGKLAELRALLARQRELDPRPAR